jgi:nicotinamide-nucleotide amidase
MAPAGGRAATAELVAVGTELLLGDVVDTNSAEIAARLAELGIEVRRTTAVGDEVEAIADVLAGAVGRADVVVVTGGLGPTQDDLTRVALAAVAGVELVRDEAVVADLAGHFARHGWAMADANLQQADLPVGGWWLTRVGTAPGIGIELGGGVVYCVPGVPREMRRMLADDVLPDLRRRLGAAVTVTRSVRTAGLGESQMADRLAGLVARVEAAGAPTIAFLASGGEARVKVTARAATREAALALVDPVVAEVVPLLGEGVVGLDDEGVEHAIARLLGSAGLTLAVAESATGGGVGARLVQVPGASAWFAGGLITYATASKAALAGVGEEVLAAHGPVSAATAEALAVGAADRLGADVGLAVVGVAGPEPQGGQPVGTVWVGVVGPDGFPRSRTVAVPGDDRVELQGRFVQAALTVLHRALVRLVA